MGVADRPLDTPQPSQSPGAQVLRRLARNRGAAAGGALLVALVGMAAFVHVCGGAAGRSIVLRLFVGIGAPIRAAEVARTLGLLAERIRGRPSSGTSVGMSRVTLHKKLKDYGRR